MSRRTPYSSRKDALENLPPFDPNKTDYTEYELSLYTDQMLRDGGNDKEHPFLFQEHIEPRWRKEVRVESGTPDATITNSLSPDGNMIYNRIHPNGRKVNSLEQRKKNSASWYR